MPVFGQLHGNLYQAKIAPGFVEPYKTKDTFDDLIKAEDTAQGLIANMKRDQVLNADFNKNSDLFNKSAAALNQVSKTEMHPRDKLNAVRKLAVATANDPSRMAQLKSVDERNQYVKQVEENKSLSPKFKEFAIERSDEEFEETGGTQPLEKGGHKTYSATQTKSPNYVADQDVLNNLKFIERGSADEKTNFEFDKASGGLLTEIKKNGWKGVSHQRVASTADQLWNQNWYGLQDSHRQEALIDVATELQKNPEYAGMSKAKIAKLVEGTAEGQQMLNSALAEKKRIFIDNATSELAGGISETSSKKNLDIPKADTSKEKTPLPVEVIPNLETTAVQNSDGSISFNTDIWGNLVKTPEKLEGEKMYEDFQKTRADIANEENPILNFVGTGVTGIAQPFIWSGTKIISGIDYVTKKIGLGNEPADKNSDDYKRAERRARQLNPNYDRLSEGEKEDLVKDAGKRWASQTYKSNMISLTPSPDAVKQNEAETTVMFGNNQDIKSGLSQNQSTVRNWTVTGEDQKLTPKQLSELTKEKSQAQYLGYNYDPFSHNEYGSKNFAFTDSDDKPRVATAGADISKKNETTQASLSRGTDKYVVKPYLINKIYNVMNYQATGKGKVDYYEGNTASEFEVNYTPDGKLYLSKGKKVVPVQTKYADGTPMTERDIAIFAAYTFDKNF